MSRQGSCPTVSFSIRSEDRVKMVDIHPREPIFIVALYSGVVNLWNLETQTLMRSFETGTGLPVRCARFISRIQSFICGADDMNVRVYNYNTMERIKIFQAHDDFIRSIAVHDQLTIVLTSSDDGSIRQWDWSNDWVCQMTYIGHTNYCMAVNFNPSDASSFATGSLDFTVRVWKINNPYPSYQLEGHEAGVNCVEYYPRGDKPYLLSGSDDKTVRLWDYQTKACLQVFTFHSHNITAVLFHPDIPIILSVAEDFDMKIISSETFRLLYNLDHSQMGRAWSMAAKRYANAVIVAYDNGVTVFNVGADKPVFSMDSSGRVFVASGNEISRIDIKGIPCEVVDGEILTLPSKDLGTVEASVQKIMHGPGGQCIALIGDSDYTVVSTLALRPKSYGSCISFAWGPENGSYAVLETPMTLKIFKGFKVRATVPLREHADKLFAGPLLAVRTASNVAFYDWVTLSVVRLIDEQPNALQWSTSGELVALVTKMAVFLLKFNSAEVVAYLKEHDQTDASGLPFAFDLIEEVEKKVRDVVWAGDCMIFIDYADRLNYYIGGEINNIGILSRSQYLLGYVGKENRVFCIDKDKSIISYVLKVEVIEYMTAIVHEDFDTATQLLTLIEDSHRYKLAQFLESRGLLRIAMDVTTDDDHRFELAIRLKDLEFARQLAERQPQAARWKQVGDIALELSYIDVAIHAYWNCGDYCGLLLIFFSLNDMDSISRVGDESLRSGKTNLAFTCYHLVQRHIDAVNLLFKTGRFGEAAFYARAYVPEKIEEAVAQWKISLAALPRLREAIANPTSYPNLFPCILPQCLQQKQSSDACPDKEQLAEDNLPVSAEALASTQSKQLRDANVVENTLTSSFKAASASQKADKDEEIALSPSREDLTVFPKE